MTALTGHATTLGVRSTAIRPRLLVSVRSVDEARAAIAGGADIIDVKEPAAGALGMAAVAVIEAIAAFCNTAGVPCSAALGELPERGNDPTKWRLSAHLTWAKVGLAGCRDRPHWPEELRTLLDERLHRSTGRIAVAYVDADRASAPSLSDVAEQARRLGCVGLLLDTWDKSGGGLLSWVTAAELSVCCTRLRDEGLFVAAAGRLTESDLPAVIEAGASIVAVRSVVCAGGDRSATVTTEKVARFRGLW